MNRKQISHENFFVIRTPRLPSNMINNIEPTSASTRVHITKWLALKGIKEALYVASPSLLDSLPIWQSKPDSKQGKKIELSLLKYMIRMCSRPTPFGLFSGITLGHVTDKTQLVCSHYSKDTRKTRLDMFYLGKLKTEVVRSNSRSQGLLYQPNNSHYIVANQLRYIESYQSDSSQQYRLSAVESDEYLQTALNIAKSGINFYDMVTKFCETYSNATTTEVESYIQLLIDESILQPKVPLPLTGLSPDNSLINSFNDIGQKQIADQLSSCLFQLERLDLQSEITANDYRNVRDSLQNELLKPEENKLFQTDVLRKFNDCTISSEELEALCTQLKLIHKTNRRPSSLFSAFITRFNQRFEGQFVPLEQVLDDESGLSFSNETGYETPLIAGLHLRKGSDNSTNEVPTLLEAEIERTISLSLRSDVIQLTSEHLNKKAKSLPEINDLPASFAAMISCYIDKNKQHLIKFNGAYGPSAANLLGRFSHLEKNLKDKLINHLNQEEAQSPDVIFAEIAHLPEGRPGNVIARPHLRDYEITFMADSSLEDKYQIPFKDLHVWIENHQVKLWSKKLNKQIIPRLSCAHNYSNRSLSAYTFLSMIQHQSISLPSFHLPSNLTNAAFTPRIMLDNLILAEKSWKIPRGEFEKLAVNEILNKNQWNYLEKTYHLERYVIFSMHDNVLQIDLTNPSMLAILLSESKGMNLIPLKEALSQSFNSTVSDANGDNFNNEIIIPFFNPEATKHTCLHENPGKNIAAQNIIRRFAPGSEWLSLKIYSGNTTVENLLSERLLPLIEQHKELFNKWFFIRYGDPDWHIRLRFQGSPAKLYGQLLPILNSVFEPLLAANQLHRIEVSTYEREVERYGGPQAMELVETLFMADSQLIATTMQSIDEFGEDMRWRIAVLSCNWLFGMFGYNDKDTLNLLTRLRAGFGAEFNESAVMRKQLGKRFKEKQALLEADMARLAHLSATNVATAELSASQLELHRLLQQWRITVEPMIAALKALNEDGKLNCSFDTLINSLLHMHNNRLFKAYGREQELVVHDFSRRFYFSKIQKEKQH